MSAITFDDFIMNNQEENPEPMENNAILVPHSLSTAVIPQIGRSQAEAASSPYWS